MPRASKLIAIALAVTVMTVGSAVAALYDTSFLAGEPGTPGLDDGTGASARFSGISGMVKVGGKIYVADEERIRVLDPATGSVATLAGATGGCVNGSVVDARFGEIAGITAYNGDLYVTDLPNRVIRKIDIDDAAVTTLTGAPADTCSNTSGATTDGGATTARFSSPYAITAHQGFLWVADSQDGVLRRVDPATGTVVTVAGQPGVNSQVDGFGTGARFLSPRYIAGQGNLLYISETNGGTIRTYNIATTEVSTVAGDAASFETLDGTGTAAHFNRPRGLAISGGRLYIAEYDDHVIRRMNLTTKVVTTIAGTVSVDGGYQEGADPIFDNPWSLVATPGTLFIGDFSNYVVRKMQIPLGDTAITAAVTKSASKMTVKGKVTPSHPGKKVTVTFYKRKAGVFRKLTAKTVTLTPSSSYAASLARRAPGTCKVTSRFAGDVDHYPSAKSVTFAC